ncbi:MAG: RCC1 domain-containing protein, partial [bacterium]
MFDYVLQQVPAGITYRIDTSLQSPATPGVVRITFDVGATVAPGDHYAVVIHAVIDGRAFGTGRVALHVLPSEATATTSEAVAIAAGEAHSLAALADGSVLAWGDNANGQLGINSRISRNEPSVVRNLDGIVGVAAGGRHSLALTSNGIVWAWGYNSDGQLGIGSAGDHFGGEPVPIEVQGVHNIQAIAAGERHSLALKLDGTVWAWGDGARGAVGSGSDEDSVLPVEVQGLPRIRAIAAGNGSSLAVGVDGSVWIWGALFPAQGEALVPVQVAGLSNIRAIATRNYAALAVDDEGRVWGWGRNLAGQLGDGTTTDRVMPVVAQGLPTVIEVALRNYRAFGLTADGTVWQWGDSSSDEPQAPAMVPGLEGVSAIAAGGNHTLALLGCGQLWAWGSDNEGQLGIGMDSPGNAPTLLRGVGDDSGCRRVMHQVHQVGASGRLLTTDPGPLEFNGMTFRGVFD